MERTRTNHALTVALATLMLAPAAVAQVGPGAPGASDMAIRLAKAAGGLNTSAQLCGMATAAEAETARAEGRAQLEKSGFGASAFDEGFAQGVQEARARWDRMTGAERTSACEELERTSEAMKKAAAP